MKRGGWILKDPSTGDISIDNWPAGAQAGITPTSHTGGKVNGKDVIGLFHTHPNTGPGWQESPSRADINFTKNDPDLPANIRHYVIGSNKIFEIGRSGSVTEVGNRTTIFSNEGCK